MDQQDSQEVLVSLTVICKDPFGVQKAAEIISRAGTSLALEGYMVSMNMSQFDPSIQEGVDDK